MTATAVTYARQPPRRTTTRAGTWWGRAWVRAVEEAAYSHDELHAGRALSRSGGIGQITLESGRFVAACVDRGEAWSVTGTVPVLDPIGRRALVEVIAAESGHLAALLAGELPHRLVEHAEEAGVELLPYGAELGSSCGCDAWLDPCAHALAVFLQVAWLIDADPLVLLRVRGLGVDELQAESAALAREDAPPSREGEGGEDGPGPDTHDLAAAMDAAARAARILALADDPDAPVDHLV